MISDRKKQIFVTDLDGTLLDDNYRWDPAIPSLKRIRELGFPLVLNSSKTLPEIQAIAAALPTDAPLIAENGGLIAIPEGSPLVADCDSGDTVAGYRILFPGISREKILQVAHDLRDSRGYAFEGFADWPIETIIAHTGLSHGQALHSRQRLATEPIHWNDSEEKLAGFSAALAPHHIRLLRGGRFIHLMGLCDKADGLRTVADLYRTVFPNSPWSTIALGDGANDLEMLNAADAAAVIPNTHGGALLKPAVRRVFTASLPGPAGWHEAITHFLTT